LRHRYSPGSRYRPQARQPLRRAFWEYGHLLLILTDRSPAPVSASGVKET